MKDKKHTLVYSTDPDYLQKIQEEQAQAEAVETLAPALQPLKAQRDNKARKGKEVVLISGFVGSEEDLQALSKVLKTRCGVGGSAKDGEIIIQGNILPKVVEILKQLGYTKTKQVGA